MTKRPRLSCDDETTWESLVGWIKSDGGWVHPAIIWQGRQIIMTETVSKGTVLARIPTTCLVSVGESSNQQQQQHDMIHCCYPVAGEKDGNNHVHSRADAMLAMRLAKLQCVSAKKDDGDSSEASFFFEPYLQTLPSSYDELPRHWPSALLDQLLTGSPLLRRVKDSRSSIRAHYQIFKDEWEKKNGTNEQELHKSSFPTFEEFDTMVGAVSSRAFGGLVRRKHVVITTNDDDANVVQRNEKETNLEDLEDAMVPLLDLLDHCRGIKGDTKNVSYERYDDDDDGSMIVIRATSDVLLPNTPLRNTYGAKGNSQLLFNYGFCLPDNLEPDGSSNDVLEFSTQEGTAIMAVVELRAGPKSYTFGGLIKALQYFYTTNHEDENVNHDEKQQEDRDGSNDMESFLNECEEEDDPWGYQDDDDDDDEEEEEEESDGNELEADCGALEKLKDALQTAKNAYLLKGDTLMETLERKDSSRHYYAAILVSSEQRTLSLYMRAIDLILKVLQKQARGADTPLVESLLEHQAFDLSTAFLQIRYPSHLCPNK